MRNMTYDEKIALQNFKREIKKHTDKDIYLKALSLDSKLNGLSVRMKIVLSMCLSKNLELTSVAESMKLPLASIENAYKSGKRLLIGILFENEKENLIEDIIKEREKSQRESDRWRDYIYDMQKRTGFQKYNLLSKKEIVDNQIIDNKTLSILEKRFEQNRTYKDIGNDYSLSVERIRQIIVRGLSKIVKYNYYNNYIVEV